MDLGKIKSSECKAEEPCFSARNLGCWVEAAGFRTKQIFCYRDCSLFLQDMSSLSVANVLGTLTSSRWVSFTNT